MKSGGRSCGWRYLLVGFWLAACGGALGSRTAGGESHFLRQCGDECGPGLECVSGLCTRGCLIGEDKCTDLAAAAICTDASIEPGALAVCDVSCESDAGCVALGGAFECEGGFCRGPLLPGQSPSGGAGGSGGSGASGGDGTGAVSTGAVSTGGKPATGFYSVPACSGLDRDGGLEMLAGGTPCPDGMACVLDVEGPGRIPPGICVGESAVGACASTGECQEGFDCTAEGDCSPRDANCWSVWTCPALVTPCSYGYAHSRVGVVDGVADCVGPCVPVTRCGCSNDDECPEGTVCDTELGQCQQPLPWQPPNECALPFEAGPCDAAMRVFAFVDGACQEQTYGGCEGNANRFDSLERCMAVCEGRPVPNPCPEGREQHITCIECLPADGCGEWATVCAEPCTTDDDCMTVGQICQNGACEMFCN